jgi:hypothetical protein
LIAHRLASAVAENGTVVASVPIFAPGVAGNVAEIRILLKKPPPPCYVLENRLFSFIKALK